MTIKSIFEKSENGTLTLEQFNELAKDSKFADLSEGKYVSKQKYDDDLGAKTSEINTLTATINARDNDLSDLKQKLADAGTDAEKLNKLSGDLTTLQTQYESDINKYKAQLESQAYEFAVKEYANTKQFSSGAAKRDFIEQMIKSNLKMDDGKLMGADDFAKKYTTDNADAFMPETPPDKPTITAGTQQVTPPAKPTLSELMKAKNDNPELQITF